MSRHHAHNTLAGLEAILLHEFLDVIADRAFISVSNLRGRKLGHGRSLHVGFRISAIAQARDGHGQYRPVVGELLEKPDLAAGRGNRHLIIGRHSAVDEFKKGFACAHQTVGRQMKVVDEEDQQFSRSGPQLELSAWTLRPFAAP